MEFGLVDDSGSVNKTLLTELVNNSRTSLFFGQKPKFLVDVAPTCDNWDECLSKYCDY